ncbi:UpxY family transcription antiterminator [bacterium]|nr:UpxY family transcription antiterminator [bacterium]MBU1064912.1 UpxY family transcription antiterminator [bacterium]MBU1634156.1 UpxY family transcription antiterminator [bacterium]MBU1874257.1 UpxY family transcription antiterminator [bacterium]
MNNSVKRCSEYILDYSALHWFALYTKSRHEKKVKELLDEKCIENYLPLKKEYHQWTDRKKLVEVPLIRGYVFVRIAAKNSVFVLEIPGAARFIKFKNEMAPIPDFQIEALTQVLASGASLQKREYLKTGRNVQVKSGPFKGVKGKIQRIENENRFIISLNFPQASFEVLVDPALLEPFDDECEKKSYVSIPLGM